MKEEEMIKSLKEKGYEIKEPIKKTIIIENIEYELEQHDNGKKLKNIKIPKGKRLLKPWEAQRLWDRGYLRDNHIFVENTNKELKQKGKVARFDAVSGYVVLNTGRVAGNSDSDLGVVFAKDLGDKK